MSKSALPNAQGVGVRLSFLQSRLHLDGLLLTALLAVAAFGVAVLYSAFGQDWGQTQQQIIRASVGFAALLVCAQIPPRTLQRWSLWIFSLGIALLLLVMAKGIVNQGAQRWIELGPVHFQPSELMKLALPLMVARLLSEHDVPPRPSRVLLALALIAAPTLLIALQPDLGTAVLVAASGLFVLFLAGIGRGWILGGLTALGAGAPLLWFFAMHDYQRERVMTFLNPESDPLGAGYHIIQSQIAIGSGGLFGKGWLNGTQAHLEFIPERHTDFVLAVVAEEFGLVGVAQLLTVYLIIVGRGLYIAGSAQENFPRLVAGALTLTFFTYVLVNAGMVSGLLPVVGLPLPLVSFGGSSLVTIMAAFGMIMAAHTHRRLWP
ncbi:rod shape-determining protein RodA [Halorhodospira neutriphila]|uniref:Peptidoglycan glycosyltransferase MrdB n=1 Tax=Halorhodospira neutriphila TaxID=168379 RepID=A0ABS1E356_9GAMM|nr:rod shape-determining protein RodA [Halorhodospira neutriphila]MBK1726138.1 rod shape-determining protein RodA [Halorhodospira neutriphila]